MQCNILERTRIVINTLFCCSIFSFILPHIMYMLFMLYNILLYIKIRYKFSNIFEISIYKKLYEMTLNLLNIFLRYLICIACFQYSNTVFFIITLWILFTLLKLYTTTIEKILRTLWTNLTYFVWHVCLFLTFLTRRWTFFNYIFLVYYLIFCKYSKL